VSGANIAPFIARATVDELAAWLEARGIDTSVAARYIDTTTWDGTASRIVSYRVTSVHHFEQSTIRAAFASAVTKVAEQ